MALLTLPRWYDECCMWCACATAPPRSGCLGSELITSRMLLGGTQICTFSDRARCAVAKAGAQSIMQVEFNHHLLFLS